MLSGSVPDCTQPRNGQIKTQLPTTKPGNEHDQAKDGTPDDDDENMVTDDSDGEQVPPPLQPKDPWKDDKNRVNEQGDRNGFLVTHRWFAGSQGLAWNEPRSRSGGFCYVQSNEGAKYGIVKLAAGVIEGWLLDDKIRNWTSLVNGDWRFHEEPVAGDPEPSFKYEFAGASVGSSNDLSPQNILRSLGFRPPHASFYLLTLNDLIRLRACACSRALRKYDKNGHYMHAAANNEELRQCLLQAAHGQFEVKDAVREIIDESMRSRRSSLDCSRFTASLVYLRQFLPILLEMYQKNLGCLCINSLQKI